jgi:hypothetical protein
VHETKKANNDYLMDELKIIPDKLVVEEQHIKTLVSLLLIY